MDCLEGVLQKSVFYSRSGNRIIRPSVSIGYRAAIARYRDNLHSLKRRMKAMCRGNSATRECHVLMRAVRSISISLRGHRSK
jgi:hypothetical protein